MHTPPHPSLAPHGSPVQLGTQAPVPHTFATPPPPHVSPAPHAPQSTRPAQLFRTSPHLSTQTAAGMHAPSVCIAASRPASPPEQMHARNVPAVPHTCTPSGSPDAQGQDCVTPAVHPVVSVEARFPLHAATTSKSITKKIADERPMKHPDAQPNIPPRSACRCTGLSGGA